MQRKRETLKTMVTKPVLDSQPNQQSKLLENETFSEPSWQYSQTSTNDNPLFKPLYNSHFFMPPRLPLRRGLQLYCHEIFTMKKKVAMLFFMLALKSME